MKFRLFILTFLLFYQFANSQIQFSEVAAIVGCDDSSYGFGTLGGGISFFDFDNDGWDDLTLSSEIGEPVRFFKNNQGSFSPIDFGLDDPLQETKTVIWADYDNDNDYDFLAISNSGTNKLYENDGEMNFIDVTVSSGLATYDLAMWGGSWGDYDKDGFLDLFIAAKDVDDEAVYNSLYHNNGNGTFTNVSIGAGISTATHVTFCSAFFDFDKDGWQDIYLANDRTQFPNLLYKNNGDGTFTDVSEASGTNIAISAMSTTIDDYNDDGWLDIYVSNTPQGNVFLRNNGDGTFTDVAEETGTVMEAIAWGSVFLDADNDADKDLYVSSSQIGQSQVSAAFYRNDGQGNYSIPVDAGFENDVSVSYANAKGDINNDGYPDIAVLNYEPNDMFLWRNDSSQENNWLKVKLRGQIGNSQGIGSWIEISVNGQKQYNYTLCGEGYLGQNSAFEFFGIGDATSIDYIKVNWLSGIETIIENPDINQHLIINESEILSDNPTSVISSIIVYPNPTSNLLQYIVPRSVQVERISVRDIQGRMLNYEQVELNSNSLDMTHFANGTYYITFYSKNDEITKKVILKQ